MNLDNLKETRKGLDLTQWELAKKLDVSPQTIRAWENGVMEPREENRKALEAVLKDETE